MKDLNRALMPSSRDTLNDSLFLPVFVAPPAPFFLSEEILLEAQIGRSILLSIFWRKMGYPCLLSLS